MSKRIPLINGGYALCDDEDFVGLSTMPWYHNGGEARTHRTRNTRLAMHQAILETGPGQAVKHMNGDRLDNRRENLYLTTWSNRNHEIGGYGSSKYKGVNLCTSKTNPWRANIMKDTVSFYLGLYDDEREAALAVDVAAKILYGKFAYVNFPDLEASTSTKIRVREALAEKGIEV